MRFKHINIIMGISELWSKYKQGAKDNVLGYVVIPLAIVVLIVVISVLAATGKLNKSEKKEGFLLTSQGAYIDPTTGAMKGPGIMTNGFTRRNMDDMWKEVKEKGFTSDKPISLGVGSGNGFDKSYENQLAINDITKSTDGTNYQSLENLDEISKKIGSNQNNANNNLYTRAGSKPTKMIIEPNGIRGVIDAKYLPDRDKNYQIATVNSVVPVQGYDVNIERLGEYLIDTHFSQISKNGKHNRIPTAAGAIGGGDRMNTQQEGIEFDNGNDGAAVNASAINNVVEVSGDKLVFKEQDGKKIGVQLEAGAQNPNLKPDNTYVRGNHQ